MFCSKCNKEIADDSRFCEFCGAAVETKETLNSNGTSSASADNQKEKKRHILPDLEYFDALLSLSPRPTRWLNFYVKVLFPLSIIFFMILSISIAMTYSIMYGYENGYPFVYLVIPLLAFYIYTCFELLKMSRKSFIFNALILIINMLIIYRLFETFEYIAFCILYIIPNFVYFITKRFLFFDNELHKAADICLVEKQKDRKKPKSKSEYFDAIRSLSPRPTKWLYFYVNISFPLGIIFCIKELISTLIYFQSYWYYYDDMFIASAITANVGLLVFIVYTYINLRQMSAKGYISNIVFLVIVSFTFMLTRDPLIFDPLMLYIFGTIALLFLYTIPNLIYFKKRKNLFYDEELHKAALDKIS